MPEYIKALMINELGIESAQELWPKAQEEYQKLLPTADGESSSRKKNMVEGIFPFAAVYRVLLQAGMNQSTAMDHMFAMMKSHTMAGNRKNYQRMGKLPFFFALFRKMFSMGLKGDSWTVEWVSNDRNSFVYNIKTCLWHDTCTKLGIPELCQIFCRNDELNFTDVSKHLYFQRSQALGYGGDCCDFHFYPKKP